MRTFLALILVVVAAGAVMVASIAFWGQRTLADADGFGDAVSDALGEPEVSRLVAREAIDALAAELPALGEARGPIVGESSRILRQERFRDVTAALASSAYQVVIDARGGPVVVDVDEVYPAVRRAARTVAPEVARELPAQTGLGEVELLRAGVLPDLSPVADGFTLAGIAGVVIALAALLAALAVGPDRGVVLGLFGAAMVVGGLLVLLLADPIVDAATGPISDDAIREAIRATASSFAGPLRTQSIVLIAVGAVIAVAGFLVRSGRPPRRAPAYR